MMILSVGIQALLFSADMLLKQHVEENVSCKEETKPAGDKIILRKVYNKGFMLHALDKHPRLIKSVTAVMGVVLIIYNAGLFMKRGHRIEKLGTAIFSAGAYSNIFDRLVRGKVIDYIGFNCKNEFFSKLTVNLADIFIVAGLAVMAAGKLFTRARPRS